MKNKYLISSWQFCLFSDYFNEHLYRFISQLNTGEFMMEYIFLLINAWNKILHYVYIIYYK